MLARRGGLTGGEHRPAELHTHLRTEELVVQRARDPLGDEQVLQGGTDIAALPRDRAAKKRRARRETGLSAGVARPLHDRRDQRCDGGERTTCQEQWAQRDDPTKRGL